MRHEEMKYCFLKFMTVLTVSSFIFLIGEAEGKVRHYATEIETVERVFPNTTYEKITIEITQELREKISKSMGKKFYDKQVQFYKIKKNDEVLAYSIVMNVVGKTKKITFMVSIDFEGRVQSVDILVFRESQGYEIKNKRWLNQFYGKNKKDKLRVKRDIDNISGATLSARAITKGVKKALFIFETLK